MKIAVPAESKEVTEKVYISFGRTPFFLIYDSETDTYDLITNTAAQAQGGAGIKAAQLVVDSGADAVVSNQCGQNAADVLIAGKVKMYKATKDSISGNLKACIKGELSELSDIHAGYHGNV